MAEKINLEEENKELKELLMCVHEGCSLNVFMIEEFLKEISLDYTNDREREIGELMRRLLKSDKVIENWVYAFRKIHTKEAILELYKGSYDAANGVMEQKRDYSKDYDISRVGSTLGVNL